MASESINLNGFTRVDIKGAFRFEVSRAEAYRVNIEQTWRRTRVYREGDFLIVEHPWYDVRGWFVPWNTPRLVVEMPDLYELRVSGASHGSVAGFELAHEFKLNVRGASHLNGDLAAANCDIDLAGASDARLGVTAKVLNVKVVGASKLTGDARAERGEIESLGASKIAISGELGDAVIRVAGGGHLDMDGFSLQNANIRLLGASRCSVNVKGRLDAELAGASRLVYGGSPVLGSLKAVGASTISPR